jgi:hypothetical protein
MSRYMMSRLFATIIAARPGACGAGPAGHRVLLRAGEPLTGRQLHGLVSDRFSLWSVQEALKALSHLGIGETRTVGRATAHNIDEDHSAVAPLRALSDPIAALTWTVRATIDSSVDAVLVFGSIARARPQRAMEKLGSGFTADCSGCSTPAAQPPARTWYPQVPVPPRRTTRWRGRRRFRPLPRSPHRQSAAEPASAERGAAHRACATRLTAHHFTSERSTFTTATIIGTTSHTRLVTASCDQPSPAS